MPPSDFSGRGGPVRRPGLAGIDEGAAGFQQRLQRLRGQRRSRIALDAVKGGIGLLADLALGRIVAGPCRALISGLRFIAEARGPTGHGLAAINGGVEQIGEIAFEWLQRRLARLGIGRAGAGWLLRSFGLVGLDHGAVGHRYNMGRNSAVRERVERRTRQRGDRRWQERGLSRARAATSSPPARPSSSPPSRGRHRHPRAARR